MLNLVDGHVYDNDINLGEVYSAVRVEDDILYFTNRNGDMVAAPSERWGDGARAVAEAYIKAHKDDVIPEPVPTIESINAQVVAKIRERYDINEEAKMLRLGILDSSDAEFIAYNAYVEECRAWGDAEKQELI